MGDLCVGVDSAGSGALEFFQGVESQALLGARLTPGGYADPLLQSQFRFLAAVWFGFGVLLIVFASDVKRYAAPLRIALAIVVVGGCGRLISAVQFGLPDAGLGKVVIAAALAAELVVVPLLLVFLSRVVAERADP